MPFSTFSSVYAEDGKWTREQRCHWVVADDWSHFTLGAFKQANKPSAAGRVVNDKDFDKRKHNIATALMREGEIARAFRVLQTANVPRMSSEEVYETLQTLHPSHEDDNELPIPPRNLPETELDCDTVKRMISQAKHSISPCGISSLRYDLLK